jgi:hypothetical protein
VSREIELAFRYLADSCLLLVDRELQLAPLLTTMSDVLRSKHNEHDDHRDNDQPYQS